MHLSMKISVYFRHLGMRKIFSYPVCLSFCDWIVAALYKSFHFYNGLFGRHGLVDCALFSAFGTMIKNILSDIYYQ